MKHLDIVVLGATGFSGTLVVKLLAKLCAASVKWGIAARSQGKINDLLKDLGEKDDNVNIPVFVVDIHNNNELFNVANQTKILLNCVGPYTVTGDKIVQACIQSGTHYIDISAEVNFILDLYRKYDQEAVMAKTLVIPSCGFASLYAASGLLYLEEEFQGTLSSVKCYTQLNFPKRAYFPWPGNCLVHYGTWESLVHVMTNMKSYQRMKKEIFPKDIVTPIQSSEIKRNFFHRHNGKIWYPYPGPDEQVLELSQRYLLEKDEKKFNQIHTQCFTTMPLLIHLLIIPIFFMYYYLSYFYCFTKLLWKFPRFFTLGYMSHKGPTEEMNKRVNYDFTFIGKGWDKTVDDLTSAYNKKLTIKVSSRNCYEGTALAIVVAALTLLEDRSKMPEGGVVQVGAAFKGTDLVRRLRQNDVKFEVITNTDVK